MANQLTPTLTDAQLKQNITALQQQKVSNDHIQEYVNNYQKGQNGSYVLKGSKPPPAPAPAPAPSFTDTLKSVGNAVTSSEQTLGKGLSTVNSAHPQEILNNTAADTKNVADVIAKIHLQTDPARKQHLIDFLKSTYGQDFKDTTAGDINPGFDLSNKQVIGAAAGTALDAASFGSYGEAAKGAETGQLLTKVPKTVEEIAAAKAAAEGMSTGQKFTKVIKTVGKGAAQGYGYDVAGNLQADKTDFLKPGAGTAVGAGIPLAVEAVKGAGFIAKEVAKHTASALSGVPKDAIEEAFKNPDAVQVAIRTAAQDGEGAAQKVYQNAVDALDTLKTARSSAYEENLAKVPGVADKPMGTAGVKTVFTTTMKDFGATGGGRSIDFTNVALDDVHLNKLDKLQTRIYGWTDTTPTGLNRLRQVIDSYKLGGINLGSSEKKFNSIVTALRSNLSEYVGSRVPQIAEMNKRYAAESEVIDNITKQLKLNSADPNTALRKLLNVFNPKSQVYRPVVEQLGEKGAHDLMADIAGLTMSKWTPDGIAKYLDTALGAGALLHPALIPEAIPVAAMSSPRIVGETVTAAGKIANNKTAQAAGRAAKTIGLFGKKAITRQAGLSK